MKTAINFLVALLTVVVLATSVSAAVTSAHVVNVNGIDLSNSNGNIAAFAGQTIPVKVTFTANVNASDVRVIVSLPGYRDDIESRSARFDVVQGRTYTQTVWLTVPSDVNSDDTSSYEDYTLSVRVESKTDSDEFRYTLNLQRDSYKIEILSVENPTRATAGATLPVDVVLKNTGIHNINDAFVTVSIPELGISGRAYFGDLSAQDTDSENDNTNSDSHERTVYLAIPTNVAEGTYTLEVKAEDRNSKDVVKKSVNVAGSASGSDIFATVTSQTVGVGQDATYTMLLINPTNNVKVYTIVPETSSGLAVSVDKTMISVGAGESATLTVKARSNTDGNYNFNVAVYSGNDLVKKVSLNIDARGTSSAISFANPMTVLAIVLTIVFLVLLIVLIVLLTRKPQKEEFGESYY